MNLWASNTPNNFWKCIPDPSADSWEKAYQNSFKTLGLPIEVTDIEQALLLTLGEGQFGENHWKLGRLKRLYYGVKNFVPKKAITILKMANSFVSNRAFPLAWPVEDRYVLFQRSVIRELLKVDGKESLDFINFWPDAKRFSFVLTHDVESQLGRDNVRAVADLEESLGFRSSFNFVPEKYSLDEELILELLDRGFEVGVHGLKHDGKLFSSRSEFSERAQKINHYLKKLKAVGFRTPFTHREPEWMQALDVEYDLSFFDTDPYEPMSGGGMSIWPYSIGKFLELPYTLVQDSTLYYTLEQKSPKVWEDKVEFIKAHSGMALLNSHPDYLIEPLLRNIYINFLKSIKEMEDCWHALPREVSSWWKKREGTDLSSKSDDMTVGRLLLEDNQVIIQPSY